MFVPRAAFTTKGVGKHKEKLTSFEMALRDAKIAEYNLVKASSIFPPNCKFIPRSVGLRRLKPGQVVYTVMSEDAIREPHRLVAASVGMAIPKNPSQYGYLSEHHGYGQTDNVAGEYAEDLAAFMLATILGAPFDPDKSYDKQKDIWKISGHQVKTRN